MNVFDPLETELRELRPRRASERFKGRVLDRLKERTQTTTQNRAIWVACGLAAACLLAVVLWQQGPLSSRDTIVTEPSGLSPIQSVPAGPTVLAYRHALTRSPKTLETVLQRLSASTLPPNPVGATYYAFRRSDVERFD
jgi:hypothetical protein